MLPWAEIRFSLSTLHLKGPVYFQLIKKVRREIDNLLGSQLNLRKSIRQEMTTLLCSIPQFVRFVQNGNTPKWLKKKSYYTNCLLFFHLRNDLTHGEADESLAHINALPHIRKDIATSHKHPVQNRKTKPAFAPRRKGGVFGLQKRKF